jgi:hypothetical protein
MNGQDGMKPYRLRTLQFGGNAATERCGYKKKGVGAGTALTALLQRAGRPRHYGRPAVSCGVVP